MNELNDMRFKVKMLVPRGSLDVACEGTSVFTDPLSETIGANHSFVRI